MKSDIFFFITSFVVILLAIFHAMVLWQIMKFARNLNLFLEEIKEKVQDSEEFFRELGNRFASNVLFRLLFPSWKGKRNGKRRNHKSSVE